MVFEHMQMFTLVLTVVRLLVEYYDEHVCLAVCLYVSISQKPRRRTSPNFLCVFPTAMTRSSSGGVAVRYVLPV